MANSNFLTDVEGFLQSWKADARPGGESVSVALPPRGAFVYTRHDPQFVGSLERRVRDLVIALTDKAGCVTYSSCEGHRAGRRRSFQPLHVGIIARSHHEHEWLRDFLRQLTRRANRLAAAARAPRLGARALVRVRRLDSEASSRPCLDLTIEPCGAEAEYFNDLPAVTRQLISLLDEPVPGISPRVASAGSMPPSPTKMVAFCESSTIARHARTYIEAKPYPHLRVRRLLHPSETRDMLAVLDTGPWRSVERREYQFDVIDLLGPVWRQRPPLAGFLRTLRSAPWRRAVAQVAGFPVLTLDTVHVHRMLPGQSVDVHTDGEGHPAAVRLVLYLDTRRRRQGGVHLLLRERRRDFAVESHVVPRAGDALLFPMGGDAFHAVTALRGRARRHSMVVTYIAPKPGDHGSE